MVVWSTRNNGAPVDWVGGDLAEGDDGEDRFSANWEDDDDDVRSALRSHELTYFPRCRCASSLGLSRNI